MATAIIGDVIMLAAVVLIVALEIRKRRRRDPLRQWRRDAARAYAESRRHRQRGQALVESAILMAIFLPLVLVASQIALLLAYHLAQVNATATIAAVAAQNGPGAAFDAAVASEAARIGCEAPDVTVATPDPAGVVVVGLRCTWRAPVYTDASWPVSTSASAYLSPSPTIDPTPEAPNCIRSDAVRGCANPEGDAP